MVETEHTEALKTACPHWMDDSNPVEQEAYTTAWRAAESTGKTPLILFPDTAEQVSAILKICNEHGIYVFPQGGNSGLVGGSIPDASNKGIVINTKRMNKIGKITPSSATVTVGAGVIVDKLKEAADAQELLYPMEFGATGSAFIGGTVATNAGGANAIRYGVTRDLVVGMTVVTPTGEILKLGGTLKDTAGPQLQHLIIGGEGMFGIVTDVEVKLFSKPQQKEVVLMGLPDAEAAQELLALMQGEFGKEINVFEIIDSKALALAREKLGVGEPFGETYPFYVLAEVTSQDKGDDAAKTLSDRVEAFVARAMGMNTDGEELPLPPGRGEHLVKDMTHDSGSKGKQLWGFRENISEASKLRSTGSSGNRAIYFDTVVPVRNMAAFERRADELLHQRFPEQFAGTPPQMMTVGFGHFGDGNIHFHVIQPKETHDSGFNLMDHKKEIEEMILNLAIKELGGSGWAEHGIGTKNVKNLGKFTDPAKLALMQAMRRAFDPNGIMNPGRGIPMDSLEVEKNPGVKTHGCNGGPNGGRERSA